MREKTEFSYNGKVGRWWLERSLDRAHRRAYRKIADFIRDSYVREPGMIADYACGPGDLLSLLSVRFRHSKLVGLDGSSYLLGLARRRFASLPPGCSDRISLIETPLPDLKLMPGKADLAIFCFPNMVPSPDKDGSGVDRFCLSENDRRVARSLSLAAGPGGDFDPPSVQEALEQGRCISLNLRRLLARGGICIRVEYATMQRHRLSPLDLLHVSFEEGSLETAVDGRKPRQWFRLLASAYFRSHVLEDVYEQTGDERDRHGGFLITVLRAI